MQIKSIAIILHINFRKEVSTVTKHFFDDYLDTVECSLQIKELTKSRTDADAVLTMFLAFYSCGNYGKGTKKKALYAYENMTIAIQVIPTGKLYVSLESLD